MVFDVMVEVGKNVAGKQQVQVYRVHDRQLSKAVREYQIQGQPIIAVIPLFVNKREQLNPVGEIVEASVGGEDLPDVNGF